MRMHHGRGDLVCAGVATYLNRFMADSGSVSQVSHKLFFADFKHQCYMEVLPATKMYVAIFSIN